MDYLSPQIDYYVMARDSALKALFNNYPNIIFKQMSIEFSFPRSSNGDLVLQILENIHEKDIDFANNCVNIHFSSLHIFIDNHRKLWDLLCLISKWKSLQITFNDTVITRDSFKYIFHFLLEVSGEQFYFKTQTTKEIREAYSPKRQMVRHTKDKPLCIDLKSYSPREAMGKIIETYQVKYLSTYSVDTEELSLDEKVLIAENSVIVYFRLSKESRYAVPEGTLTLTIQDMTFNDLFKFNWVEFRRGFTSKKLYIDYIKFKGLKTPDLGYFHYLNSRLPKLKLVERYNDYPGIMYHFIIFELIHINGNKAFGIGRTQSAIHQFVMKVCKELEAKNYSSLLSNGCSSLDYSSNKEFIDAFLSWKGNRRKWILENKLFYFVLDDAIKEETEMFLKYDEIHSRTANGDYDYLERGNYTKPVNRWKTEELVFNIVKNLYGNYQVIYQYRPFYLRTDSGQLSYDIYVCGLKVAIEYQGKQHFEPVEYFGGESHFVKQIERDEIKNKLSEINGVTLVYINYNDDITPKTIREKIEKALQ